MIEEKIAEFAKSIVLRCEESFDFTNLQRTVLFHHAKAEIRLAIKESSEEKDEVIRRLSLATDSDSEVGSCDCLTKSPDIQHHKKGCKYRLVVERDEALHEIQALKTIIQEQDRAIAKMVLVLREPLNDFD